MSQDHVTYWTASVEFWEDSVEFWIKYQKDEPDTYKRENFSEMEDEARACLETAEERLAHYKEKEKENVK